MVKKEYCGNESLGLAWDRVEVSQIYPFYTTFSTNSEDIETFSIEIVKNKSKTH